MNNIGVKLALVLVLLLPAYTHAGPIIRSGDKVSVEATQTLKGDFYGLASTITLSGKSENDAYIVAGSVTVNAPVGEDLTVVGGVVQIHGNVDDDIRILGGEVTLASEVKGDVVVVGGTLTILSTAHIYGDILFYGGDLIVDGDIDGSITGNADTISLNATIGGDLSVSALSLFSLGESAHILGNVKYESKFDMERSIDAVIDGTVQQVEIAEIDQSVVVKRLVLYVSMLLFGALVLFLTLRRQVVSIVDNALQKPSISGIVGIGVFVLLFFISILFLVSGLGSFVGIILLASYVVLTVCALLGTGIVLGTYTEKIITKKKAVSLRTILIGFVVLGIILMVPVLGVLVALTLMMISLGSICIEIYKVLRVQK